MNTNKNPKNPKNHKNPHYDSVDNQAATLKELTRKAAIKSRQSRESSQSSTSSISSVPGRKAPHTLAVTSGKGGVGKTLLAVNMAIHFAREGHKVLVIDADLGLANIDVILGLSPQHTIQDVLNGHLSIEEVAVTGPAGITILPAASGVSELSHLTDTQKLSLMDHIDHWDTAFDMVIVDTGAGISPNVLYFLLAVEEVLIVATPDPTSITDAYALMKVMFKQHHLSRFNLLVNQVKTDKEALSVYKTLYRVADRYLDIGLNYFGFVPSDLNLVRAVRKQKAAIELYPSTPASQAVVKLSETVQRRWSESRHAEGKMTFFWRQLLKDEDKSENNEQ